MTQKRTKVKLICSFSFTLNITDHLVLSMMGQKVSGLLLMDRKLLGGG